MKSYKWAVVGIAILILALPLTGCVSNTEYETLQEQNTSLQVELGETQSDLAGLQVELDNLQISYSELEAGKVSITKELAEIEEVYPPRNFKDKFELTKWRKETGIVGSRISWVDACLKLQEIGLSDGYILSIDVDIDTELYGESIAVSLTVIAGEYFYMLYPDGLEVYLIAFAY